MNNRKNFNKCVEILDTTLRDGEQTPGVAFAPAEKLAIAQMLIGNLKIDRLEIGSARVSDGEKVGVKNIIDWAKSVGKHEAMEILSFVDNGTSIDWVKSVDGKVINLLTKGSKAHCEIQLKKTPADHFADVKREIEYAAKNGIKVNLYLEDWTNGMLNSRDYVYDFMTALKDMPIERIMLPDTLGITNPDTLTENLNWMYDNFPDARLDFHGHNDYGLVSANSLAAIKCGINGIHTTVNGLGERTGNQPLSQLVVIINDMTDRTCNIVETELFAATGMIQNISGKRCGWNVPIVGADVFTQTCGVHADGDKKGNLYVNKLLPERFGRHRNYALGKLSGKASLDKNLEELGIDLDAEIKVKVLQEIIRFGDKKKTVSASDLPFLIANALKTPFHSKLKVIDYRVENGFNKIPNAVVKIKYNDKIIENKATGDGGYDAFVKAMRKNLKELNMTMPALLDYEVRIPPGGKTDALVETTITWDVVKGHSYLSTVGVDSDQMVAAIIATEKMLNLIMQDEK